MLIDYDKLLADYNKNMETNLRGFSGGPPPFETWVPYDGDDQKSIDELITLAKEIGHEVITVKSAKGDRIDKSQKALEAEGFMNKALEELNWLQRVTVVALRNKVLTIDYTDFAGEKPLHTYLIKLEKILNEMTGQNYDLQTLNIDDRNRRQLRI